VTSPTLDDVLLIGRITGPFGVRGDLKVSLISTRPDHLVKLKQIFLGDQLQPYAVGRLHEHKASVYILRLPDVTTRDQAEELRGTEIYIRAAEAAPLDADEYFIHDLIGLTVLVQDGSEVGKVAEVIETGANDVLVVRQVGQPEILIPMVRTIVQKVDVAAGTIQVTSLDDIIPQ
jgi:16S rRNA processing protein RimM